MNLYLLRHAPAVERGTAGYEDDSKRPLTGAGRKKMRCAAKGMKALGLKFDLILSSPYVRALETAEIVVGVLKAKRKLRIVEELASEGDAEVLVEKLTRLNGSPDRILLVGHEPFLSQLVSQLVTGRKQLRLRFKKGGLCKLTTSRLKFGSCAELEWLVTPAQLALFARPATALSLAEYGHRGAMDGS